MPDLKQLAARLTALNAQVTTLTAERDDARANARILAHAYTHDSRPLPNVVATALAYPVDPTRDPRTHLGTVVAWAPASWWGGVALDNRPDEPVAFHFTNVRGATLRSRRPQVGDRVAVLFSDAECDCVLSVELQETP